MDSTKLCHCNIYFNYAILHVCFSDNKLNYDVTHHMVVWHIAIQCDTLLVLHQQSVHWNESKLLPLVTFSIVWVDNKYTCVRVILHACAITHIRKCSEKILVAYTSSKALRLCYSYVESYKTCLCKFTMLCLCYNTHATQHLQHVIFKSAIFMVC